jgi:hypothetical protein
LLVYAEGLGCESRFLGDQAMKRLVGRFEPTASRSVCFCDAQALIYPSYAQSTPQMAVVHRVSGPTRRQFHHLIAPETPHICVIFLS